ncbi:MAG: glycosyltransferase [Chloroflexi bacterium]|nr:glycosyltransferase [Chloroflexota bacterium]
MRILFISPRSAWVRYNLLASLRAMGHDVVAWDWGGGWPLATPGWQERRQRLGERLVQVARRAQRQRPFDLVFCYLYATVVGPEAVRELRGLGAPVVNFSCNNVHQFDLVAELAPHFDACYVPERSALGDYQAVGAHPIHLGMAANPAFYRPYGLAPEFDVTFVGQRYADRADYVLHLKQQGVDVRVWGAGWRRGVDPRGAVGALLSVVEDEGPRALAEAAGARLRRVLWRAPAPGGTGMAGPSLGDQELRPIAGHRLVQADMVQLFSRSRISLGFATVGDSHRAGRRLTQVRLRDFEAPMSGAFYVTEHQEELLEYFEPGRELETYVDREDLLDKVRFYLRHPERAAAIRQAGHARAQAEHTWARRFEALFAVLGLRNQKAVGSRQ